MEGGIQDGLYCPVVSQYKPPNSQGNSVPSVKRPIRIAFCITDLDPGGAERALVQLVTRLDRRRWEPAVFCLGPPGKLAEVLQSAGIPATCLGARGRADLGVVFRLYRALRQFHPEIVQTFLFHANIAGRIAGRLAGIPHCVSGIRVAERRSRWPLRIDRITNPLVETNVCVSRATADFSVEVARLRRTKVIVIPNGVDVAPFAEALPLDLTTLGLPPSARVIVAVGRLDPQKGLTYLLEGLPRLFARHGDVHLLLVGDGPERARLTRIVDEQRLTSRVHFAGWRSDVPRILKAAYCLVLPSLWEGMPNVVLEAMAASLPVVATRVEGVDELVIPGETGLIVPPASSADLTDALETMLGNSARAQAMGESGRQRVETQFSWDTMAASYDALYSRLVGEA
jgi:glycosyltransferase involved in cell wall biosynthesis